MDVLHVDCGTCIARGAACSDCVVTVLLGASGGVVDLDQDERAALEALADSAWCRRCGLSKGPGRFTVSSHGWSGRTTREDSLTSIVDKISSTKYRRS